MKAVEGLLFLFIFLTNYIHAQLNFPINHFVLDNGLNIVFLEDKSSSAFTLAIAYCTGSRDDPVGKTGLAQLMQNIMFSGSENIPPMGHFAMIRRHGGEVNAFVTEDYILFHQTLPSNQLRLALWLEAERMRGLKIERVFFERQKELLLDEAKRKLDTDPYASGFLKLNEISFVNFQYAHPVMGYIEDIQNIELEDIKNYYSDYFSPSNAWLILVGDFDTDSALSLVKDLFEKIPTKKGKPPNSVKEDYNRGELRMKTFRKGIYNHVLHVAYPIPPKSSPEFYVLKVIEYLLLHDRNSLLPREIIKKRNLAQEIVGEAEEREGSTLFTFFILGRPGIPVEMLNAHFMFEIEKFTNSPPSSWEMGRAKNNLKTDYLNEIRDTKGKAIALAKLCVYKKSPHFFNSELNSFLKVNKYDVYRVSKKYFNKSNGVFLYVVPQW